MLWCGLYVDAGCVANGTGEDAAGKEERNARARLGKYNIAET